MGGNEEAGRVLAAKFAAIFPHLDERQRRLLMGAEARTLGHGGIRLVARAAGASEATVSEGAREVEASGPPLGRARRANALDWRPLRRIRSPERTAPISPIRPIGCRGWRN